MRRSERLLWWQVLVAGIVYPAYYFFRLLPFDTASALGGFLGRTFGPRSRLSNRARKNLELAMSELSVEEREKIVRGMWDNLGRTLGEFPQMPSLTGKKFARHVEMIGWEHMEEAIHAGRGYIFCSGHFANWEVGPHSTAELGQPVLIIYRPANNRLIDKLIRKSRKGKHQGLIPKGREGARSVLKQLEERRPVGMLVDQKMNEGIPVPFFGREAMTAPALAEFARRFGVPIIPARVERLHGAHFRVTVYPRLATEGKDALTVMTEVNALFEQWIRERPEQWFWLHRRWGK